jgi:outer membrane murein-binding lipoprotein Lpp
MRGFAGRVRFAGRGRFAGRALAAAVVMTVAVAGCASTQPGDKNPGVGYTNNVADLAVKVPALVVDPCRGPRAAQIFNECGRFVTEVANTIAAMRADLPSQSRTIDALSDAVNRYQRAGCDAVIGTPSDALRTTCSTALTDIGSELDALGAALTRLPTGG